VPTAVLLIGTGACTIAAAVAPPASDTLFYLLSRGAIGFVHVLALSARVAPDPVSVPSPNVALYYTALWLFFYGKRAAWVRIGAMCLILAAFIVPRVR
jgi:hypothetical protein